MAKQDKRSEATELTLEDALVVIEQQKELIAELNSQLEKANVNKSETLKVVLIGGKKYKVNVPSFRLESGVYEAKDLEDNQALQDELFAINGQAIITEI